MNTGLPWYWWAFGLCGAGVMWWLTFRDRVIQRRPLALGLALVYTVGLLLALYMTLWRAP
jgi:hypothetical protein